MLASRVSKSGEKTINLIDGDRRDEEPEDIPQVARS